jgi:hypothetical protein
MDDVNERAITVAASFSDCLTDKEMIKLVKGIRKAILESLRDDRASRMDEISKRLHALGLERRKLEQMLQTDDSKNLIGNPARAGIKERLRATEAAYIELKLEKKQINISMNRYKYAK